MFNVVLFLFLFLPSLIFLTLSNGLVHLPYEGRTVLLHLGPVGLELLEEKTRFGILSTVTGHLREPFGFAAHVFASASNVSVDVLRKQGSLRCPLTSRISR